MRSGTISRGCALNPEFEVSAVAAAVRRPPGDRRTNGASSETLSRHDLSAVFSALASAEEGSLGEVGTQRVD
jgi:hypothetical protein